MDGEEIARRIDGTDYSAFSVKPEYIDANGHMNMGYYGVIMDQAMDRALVPIGCDWSYTHRTGQSMFVLENHMTYQREVKQGDPLSFTFQLLDFDDKRMHYFITMRHGTEGYLAATSEQIAIHVDLGTRKTCPWPDDMKATFAALLAAHSRRPRPPEVGRVIAVKRKTAA